MKDATQVGLVEGRIVHFVLSKDVCRPAIIVNAWDGKLEDGMINLQVFLDGTNDRRNLLALNTNNVPHVLEDRQTGIDFLCWITSVKHSETKEIGTWHWPERS